MRLCWLGNCGRAHLTKRATQTGYATYCGLVSACSIRDADLTVELFVGDPESICKTCLRIAKASADKGA